MLLRFTSRTKSAKRRRGFMDAVLQFHLVHTAAPPSNFFKCTGPSLFFPPLRKSRTAERTRCDCFHTQEVITPDLPQLWLRLINIDKQLMRCQAGTRPFPSCPPMTPMERKNDLDLAMSLSFIRAQRGSLIIFSGRAVLLTVPLDSSCSEAVAGRTLVEYYLS